MGPGDLVRGYLSDVMQTPFIGEIISLQPNTAVVRILHYQVQYPVEMLQFMQKTWIKLSQIRPITLQTI